MAVYVAPSSCKHHWLTTETENPNPQVGHLLANSYTDGASVEPSCKPFDVELPRLGLHWAKATLLKLATQSNYHRRRCAARSNCAAAYSH